MKEEEVYLDPRIVIYHDFLTPGEIETIKDMAKPRLERATVSSSFSQAVLDILTSPR